MVAIQGPEGPGWLESVWRTGALAYPALTAKDQSNATAPG